MQQNWKEIYTLIKILNSYYSDISIITVAEYYGLDGIVTFDEGFLNNNIIDIIF